MKTQKSIFKSLFALCLIGIIYSCEQQPINPSLKLDEVFIPEGYVQVDNLSMDNQSRLEELRLENPEDQYYYLKYENGPVGSLQEMMFPQKELLIKAIDSDRGINPQDKPKYHGVIVKKIKGDWRDEEFIIIDNQPSPKNGMKIFYTYVAENLKYPEEARSKGVQGKVFAEFIVDREGKLTKVKVVKGIGSGCDEEAVRVLGEAPNWNPGKVVDMPVMVRMILPITYKLE